MATRKAGEKHVDPDHWLQNTPEQSGSWWTAWEEWLTRHSSPPGALPSMGAPQRGFLLLGDAPGNYVYQD
ncbi:MAG: hypothetical protein ACP5SH_23105 [Syntrophobacteraceae bacterium]